MLAWWLNLDLTTVSKNVSDTTTLTLAESSSIAGTESLSDSISLAVSDVSAVVSTDSTVAPSGGFYGAYEDWAARRRRRERQQLEAEQAAQAIRDAIDREIAELLHAQETEDAEREELDRLAALVKANADRQAQDALNERVQVAFTRAAAQYNLSALLALDREMQRQFEEEEFSLLMALAIDD